MHLFPQAFLHVLACFSVFFRSQRPASARGPVELGVPVFPWSIRTQQAFPLLSGDGNSTAHGAVVSCGGRGVGSGRPGTWYLAPCLAGAEHLLLPLK